MGLLKQVQQDPAARLRLERCVAEGWPFRLLDMKLYLTRRCNLRCQMCNAWAKDRTKERELSTDEVLRILAEARQLGLERVRLFGGEPLLRADLEEIVAGATTLGIRARLVTNGTLLGRARATALVAAGLDAVEVSLDAADPVVHDQIRGASGAWARAVDGVRTVREAAHALGRQVSLRANVVVMRQGYVGLPSLLEALGVLGVDEVVLNPPVAQPGNLRARPEAYLLGADEIRHYNAAVAPRIAQMSRPRLAAGGADAAFIFGTGDEEITAAAEGRYVARLGLRGCLKPWYYAVVREDGEMVACNTVKDPATRIGNLRETPLGVLWNSERYRAFRSRCRPPRFADCARCCYNYALGNRRLASVLW